VPLDDFIVHSSDPIYMSLIATVLMKAMRKEIESDLVQQDNDTIQQRIQKLENLSCHFISEAYKINQVRTIQFMKEKQIGGYSIIGKAIKHW